MCFNNYRPFSLLRILSKVFEKVMYEGLLASMNSTKLSSKTNSDSEKNVSTYMVLVVLIDKVIKSLENKDYMILPIV